MLVARLRRKIEPNPKAPRFIVSVAGVGYKFAVRPQTADHGNALATIDLPNRFGLGDDTLAQVQNAGPEYPQIHRLRAIARCRAKNCIAAYTEHGPKALLRGVYSEPKYQRIGGSPFAYGGSTNVQ